MFNLPVGVCASPISCLQQRDDDGAREGDRWRSTAAHGLTRLRLRWPAGRPRSLALVHKHGLPLEAIQALIASVRAILPNVHFYLGADLCGQLGVDHVTWYVERTGALDACDLDLIVTLGGDGTVLRAAWLFQRTDRAPPPLLPLFAGSLGFLTVDAPSRAACDLAKYLANDACRLSLRSRLQVCIQPAPRQIDNAQSNPCLDPYVSEPVEYHLLNEVVLDRGPSMHVITLDLLRLKDRADNDDGDEGADSKTGAFITTVVSDGLIVSTPTGSSAYSLSAGGPLVHPDVPCLVVTPVAPHALSLRPFVVPSLPGLAIRISERSRADQDVYISMDGRLRLRLGPGDVVRVHESSSPVMTMCREEPTADWLNALTRCLGWNDRPKPTQ